MKKMKKILALLLCLVLAVGAVTGTLAYLTDRDSEVNVFTVGDVEIDLTEDFEQGATLMPGVKIEKEPTIKNTGKNDAWVWATIAIPSALDNDDASQNVIHFNYSKESVAEGKWTWMREDAWNVEKTVKIDDTDILYNVYTVLYQTALKPGEETEAVMTQVYMDYHIDIDPNGDWYHVVNGDVTGPYWNVEENGQPLIYVSAYAIQTDGFPSVQAAYDAYAAQWGLNGTEYGKVEKIGADAELEAALTGTTENIVVELTEDVTYDVAAWENNAMGGNETKNITIVGNGHTITFNHTNSDWNHIVTNGATLTISDAHITNAGYNNGPWNRHDLNFACPVVLNNVTSDKAMAFKSDATLKNVTISDANTSDTYAIWIQPNGQTVSLDGCTIDMIACTDGRGIKIDEQYVDAPEKVTLTVKDTKFKTEEKSAILVKSAAGADVILDKVDITEVAADSTNPVWVDEASSAYANLVVVTGGSKIVEP